MSALPPRGRTTSRNAAFQQLGSLLENRQKRHRAGLFLVQGVRPITVAVERGWPLERLLHRGGPLSRWAADTLARVSTDGVGTLEVADELLAELGERDEVAGRDVAGGQTADGPTAGRDAAGRDAAGRETAGQLGVVPELVAVAQIPDPLGSIEARDDLLVLVVDRPSAPGNLGSLIRSADAFGAHAVLVGGHAVDPWDPRVVRASTGSVFAVDLVTVAGPDEALELLPPGVAVVGTDETGTQDIADVDLTGPTVLVVGNEARGMSAAWRAACTAVVRIPIGGPGSGSSASSLNAANAGTVALYEAVRQRRAVRGRRAAGSMP